MAQLQEIVSFPTSHINLKDVSGKPESFDLTDSDDVRNLLKQIGIDGSPNFVRLATRARPDKIPSSLDGVHFKLEGTITEEVRQALRRLGAEFTSITHAIYPS